LTESDDWTDVIEYLSGPPRETSSQPDWPDGFRERFLWALSKLRDQRLVREIRYRGTKGVDEVSWEVTDEGRRILKELELI